jgi:hypothetical protein
MVSAKQCTTAAYTAAAIFRICCLCETSSDSRAVREKQKRNKGIIRIVEHDFAGTLRSELVHRRFLLRLLFLAFAPLLPGTPSDYLGGPTEHLF